MLTVDDANTILEKYRGNFFFKKISTDTLPGTGEAITSDFVTIGSAWDSQYNFYYDIEVVNSFWKGGYFFVFKGEDIEDNPEFILVNGITYEDGEIKVPYSDRDNPFNMYDMYLYLMVEDIPFSFKQMTWHPIGSLDISKSIDDVKRVFLDFTGNPPSYISIGTGDSLSETTFSSIDVEVDSHTNHYIDIDVTGVTDRFVFIKYDDTVYTGKIYSSKILPQLIADTLYKGTPQEVKLKIKGTSTYITKFQAYYKGRKLKDNIIELPYDVADEIIDLTIDLQDPEYVQSTIKLKANTEIYWCDSQSEIEEAVEFGIKTLGIGGENTTVTISELELSDCTITYINANVTDSIFNNVTFLNGIINEKGGNTYNNCTLKGLVINGVYPRRSVPPIAKYNNSNIIHCTVQVLELHATGTIKDSCRFEECTIISDGDITITGSTFISRYRSNGHWKTYFPRFLYLTGNYEVKGNLFIFVDTFTNLQFDMCVIKTVELNVNQFISDNTFILDITYGSERPQTLYYNLVDDDTIKAVRLR
jgi:hypothetical protein